MKTQTQLNWIVVIGLLSFMIVLVFMDDVPTKLQWIFAPLGLAALATGILGWKVLMKLYH